MPAVMINFLVDGHNNGTCLHQVLLQHRFLVFQCQTTSNTVQLTTHVEPTIHLRSYISMQRSQHTRDDAHLFVAAGVTSDLQKRANADKTVYRNILSRLTSVLHACIYICMPKMTRDRVLRGTLPPRIRQLYLKHEQNMSTCDRRGLPNIFHRIPRPRSVKYTWTECTWT